ncbi:hypothetical protein HPB52_017919 [Rhipicephalus sanguineus]|uniref:Uncharacterized protein n=1 Tax=Rhipicephalus sanguineus TaxID=34632 RepID=A0A9D4T452_RHISA|nr:hypothetical protein HPB52_017919 [Rhipicephalus sanguineus]
MDIFTFKNLTLWRNLRWERVVNVTGLGTDVSASDKLKQMLQNPPEKNVTAQAVNDILLLHELLDLTSWATDKKWKSFEKGCQLLVTRETASESPMRDRQITESGWGPGIDPPNILLPTQSEKASAVDMNSDEVKKNPDWNLLKTVSLATSQSEHGWKLLTLGFNMFSKKTHITEKEMIDVIAKLPGPTFGIHFQETINSMIVYDLVMFNGTSDYEAWMRMQWRRFTIIAAPAFSQEVQNQLSIAESLKPMDDLYVVQLDQLIIMKLSMLSLNASYSADIDALLSKNLDVGVTSEFLKEQKDFLSKNNVSAKTFGRRLLQRID